MTDQPSTVPERFRGTSGPSSFAGLPYDRQPQGIDPAHIAALDAREQQDDFVAVAQMEARNHKPDEKRGGCTCGFCAWSVEHVVIMSIWKAQGR